MEVKSEGPNSRAIFTRLGDPEGSEEATPTAPRNGARIPIESGAHQGTTRTESATHHKPYQAKFAQRSRVPLSLASSKLTHLPENPAETGFSRDLASRP